MVTVKGKPAKPAAKAAKQLAPVKVPANLSKLSLGKLADLLYLARADRLKLEKQAEDMKSDESRIKDHIIKTFTKDQITKVAGTIATLSFGKKVVPQVQDWDTLWAYVAKTKSFDLIQKRPSVTACQERWNLRKAIPGVEQFTLIDISCTKL